MKVRKLRLFTVTACPTGRSIGTVLREVCSRLTELSCEIIYVELHPDLANRCRISTNPTTVLLDEREEELFRLQGFTDTDELIAAIRDANEGRLQEDHDCEVPCGGAAETYILYLYRGDSLVPYETEYSNPTAVKAPRITAIRLLLQVRAEGLRNPFPSSSVLTEVNFADRLGEVAIRTSETVSSDDRERMRLALVHTLAHFGIDEVMLRIV